MKARESNRRLSRRHFLNHSALAGVALASAVASVARDSTDANSEPPDATTKPTRNYPKAEGIDGNHASVKPVQPGNLPCGFLGSLKISRLISGGNIISGWCHSRDLQFVRPLAQAYLTEKKQFDTLQLLEERGVNAIAIDMIQMGIVEKYRRERGGRIQTLVGIRQDWGAWNHPSWADLKTQIQRTIDQGPQTLFVHGGMPIAWCNPANPSMWI